MPSNEFELIKKIQAQIGKTSSFTEVGIGDDTAVLKHPLGKILATVDALVEGVHFNLSYASWNDVGHKALAVNLSDIAAKGGTPLYALVSLGIRPGMGDEEILAFYEGMSKLAGEFAVDIVGGNCTKSPTFFADVTVLGESNRPPLRSGAKVGDLVAVTGPLGKAAAGLECLKSGNKQYSKLIDAQLRPTPRVKEGKILAQKSVHATIDISDGLSSELYHLREASKVGFLIEEAKIPLLEESKALGKALGKNPIEWAWTGGEDYEILVTVAPEDLAICQHLLTVIGEVKPEEYGVKASRDGKTCDIPPAGWTHF